LEQVPVARAAGLVSDEQLQSRIMNRMEALKLADASVYANHLETHPEEMAELLFKVNDMRRYEHMLVAISKNITDGIYRSELKEGLVYVNDAFVRMFGYASQEELMQAEALNLYAHPDDRQELQETLLEKHSYSNKEILFRKKDGTKFWGMISSQLTEGTDGKVWFDGVVTDISEHKEAEQQLKRLNKELRNRNQELEAHERALEEFNEQLRHKQEELEFTLKELSDRNFELDQLVYKTTHDLRAPLSSVMGLLTLVKMTPSENERTEYLSLVENRITKLDGFVTSMLSYAKASRSEFSKEPIDFKAMIGNCLSDLEYLPTYSLMKVFTNIDLAGKTYIGDPMRMQLVLSNIIANAFKYMRISSDLHELHINIGIENDKWLKMSFEDTGIGIEAQYLDRIFDMFFRGTNNSEGSGLGLYVVRQIVEQLGGRISVQSKVNRGTTFTVWLPFEHHT
jgi:PAS domain S-box-containing protein